MKTSNCKQSDRESLLAALEDAVVTYAEALLPGKVDGNNGADYRALLRCGLAHALYALTDSQEEIRSIYSDALAEYDAMELERMEAALATFTGDRAHAVPDEE